MNLLLDAHAVIWSVDDPSKVPPLCMSTMQDPTTRRLFSVASIWEIAIKASTGKLPLSLPFDAWIDKAIFDLNLTLLPITLDHIKRNHTMAFHHRDPFDRIVAAQALADNLQLISIDVIFDAYGVRRLWS